MHTTGLVQGSKVALLKSPLEELNSCREHSKPGSACSSRLLLVPFPPPRLKANDSWRLGMQRKDSERE